MFGRLAYFLLSYDGRITRRAFWMSSVLSAVLGMVLWIVGSVLDLVLYRPAVYATEMFGDYPIILNLTPVTYLAIGVSWYLQLAIVVKRLHDRNKGAVWLWLAQVPILGSIWLIVETGFIRGTRGDNDWGTDPRNGRKPRSEPVL